MSTTDTTEPAFAAYVTSRYRSAFDTAQTRDEAVSLSHRLALDELVDVSEADTCPDIDTEEIRRALSQGDHTDLRELVEHYENNGVFDDLQITYGTLERA